MLLACLLATTAFVFANNKKFAQSLELYADNGTSTPVKITSGSASFDELATTQANPGDQQAQMTDAGGNAFPLVHKTGPSTYTPVYSQSTW